MKTLIAILALSVSSMALAAKGKMTAEQAKAATVKECQTKYKETASKSADETMEWVETEERSANAKAFKKSKCYALHEDWEKLENKHEEGEEHKD